jgi:hypothetical protein
LNHLDAAPLLDELFAAVAFDARLPDEPPDAEPAKPFGAFLESAALAKYLGGTGSGERGRSRAAAVRQGPPGLPRMRGNTAEGRTPSLVPRGHGLADAAGQTPRLASFAGDGGLTTHHRSRAPIRLNSSTASGILVRR